MEAASTVEEVGTRAGKPASAWRILGVFVALAVASGAVGFLAITKTGTADAAEVLGPAFELRAMPFEFEAFDAAELPFGQRLVRFAPRGRAPVVEAKRESVELAEGVGGEDARKIQWRKIAIGPGGAAPIDAQLVFVGQLGEGGVSAYFDDREWKSFEELDDRGGSVVVEAGKFAWSGFDARYVIVRRFELPSAYEDSARVDLSAHGRWCVLVAKWAPGVTASKAVLEELVSAFEARPAVEDGVR